LTVATSAAYALEYIGMPEARLPLAEAAIYIATAAKSNSVIKGIDKALSDIEHRKPGEVPVHLRDAHYKGASKLGHGKGYKYPHDFPGNYVNQQYLPNELLGVTYYEPYESGQEKQIKDRLVMKNYNKK